MDAETQPFDEPTLQYSVEDDDDDETQDTESGIEEKAQKSPGAVERVLKRKQSRALEADQAKTKKRRKTTTTSMPAATTTTTTTTTTGGSGQKEQKERK